MSENYNNFENQNERSFNFQIENFNPEDEVYSMFDDYRDFFKYCVNLRNGVE